MLAASLRANISVTGVPDSTAKLRDFEAKLDRISGKSAVADLGANLETHGFDEYAAKIDEAKAKALRPIEQTVGFKYNDAPVKAAIRDAKRLKAAWSGAESDGGGIKGALGKVGEALTPFGPKWTAIVAASPVALDLAGGLAAVASSAAEAAAGVGALGIAAGGVGAVGLAGIASVAIPAVAGLKEVTTAQTAYTTAVKLYGQHSKQAATALAKLHLAESKAGPAAAALSKNLVGVKERWFELTKAGQNSFLGILNDAVERLGQLMPVLAHSANTVVGALREGFDAFLKQVTGPGFNHFIETMTGTFARIVPEIGHGLADWAQIFMRIAEDAAPSLEHIVHLWSNWSDELLKSTGNSKHMEETISGLVSQTLAWVHLLGAAGQLLITVFSSGAGEGKRLVEDLTGKLEEWTNWIETHQVAVHEFFHQAAERTREFFTILAGLVPVAYEMTQALRPIGEIFLSVLKSINGLKIGNISALTVLLGAYVAARGVGKIGGAITDLKSLALAGGGTVAEGAGARAGAAGGASAISRAAAALSPGDAGLGAFGVAGGIAGGYFLTEFLASVTDPGTEGQSVAKSLFDGFNTQEVAKTEARALAGTFAREINHALSDGGNSKALESASHNRARTISQQQTEAIREEASVLDTLKSGLVTRLGDIVKLAHKGSISAAEAFGEGTPQWRKATADNLDAVIEAIKAGEHAGLITTEEGHKKIGQYLREANLVTGKDPFHIASAFTQTWKEAGGVTESGISAALAELRKMPPVSQAIAEQTMLHQVKAFEAGGKVAKGTFSRLRSAIVTELQRTRTQGGAQVEHFASEMGGSFGSLSIAAGEAFQNIGGNLGALLSKLGAHNPLQSFTVKFLHSHGAGAGSGSKYLNQVPELGKQRGGHINMGAPTGDSVPAMLERGEYVLNRNAVAAVGTQNLDAINYGPHSRFQKGGQAGRLREPQVSGSGPLHDAGQGAVHDAYGAATAYLGKHKTKGATGGVASVPGGGSVVAAIARTLFANGFNKIGATGPIGNSYAESNWIPDAMEPGTHNGGLWGFTAGKKSLASLEAYAAKRRKPWTDVVTQTMFMLKTGGLGIRSRLNAAKNPGEAARIFEELYEAAGIVRMDVREEGARKAFAMGYRNGGLVGEAEREVGVPQTGSGSKSKSGLSGHGYVNPFHHANISWGRIDEGVDFTGSGPIAAIGDSVVTNIMSGWYKGQPLVDYKLLNGPKAGQYVYVAEGINGYPSVGTHLTAGQTVANFAHGTVNDSIETGWGAAGGNGTLAGGGSGETSAGRSFYGFLKQLAGGGGWHGSGTTAGPTEETENAVSTPPIPKNIPGITKEIRRWNEKLRTYQHRAVAAKGRPKTQASIQENVRRIEKYLHALARELSKLRLEVAKKHATKHFAGQLGKITGHEVPIAKAQRRYEEASQLAEQIVSKEPRFREGEEGGEQTGELIRYINEKETPAYGKVLASEADWRNLILGAEHKAAGNWPKGIGGLEGNWEGRISNLVQNENSIESFAQQVAQEVAAWKHAHPNQALPQNLKNKEAKRKELLAKLPLMQFKEAELRKVLGEGRESFYPGGASILQPVPPLEGSGSFEDALREVQGLHWPDQHEPLATLPAHTVAGKFGGAIWQTQETIEELGFNVAEMLHSAFGSVAESFGGEGEGAGSVGGSAVAEHTERERLLEEQLKQANQRLLVRQVGEKTLGGFPYAGAFATGGLIAAKVGERGPEIAAFPSGTRIHNAHETSHLLKPHVIVNGNIMQEPGDTRDPVEVVLGDRRFGAAVRQEAKAATGVGRPFAAGGVRR